MRPISAEFDETVSDAGRVIFASALVAFAQTLGDVDGDGREGGFRWERAYLFQIGRSSEGDRRFDALCTRGPSGLIVAVHADPCNASSEDLRRLAMADLFLFEPFTATDVVARLRRLKGRRREPNVAPSREVPDRWHADRVAAIGYLTGGIAHDFNNLLTIIVTYTAMVLEELPPGTARDDLQEVRNAARRATELARRLLEFGRRGDGHDATTADANAVVRSVEKLLRPTLPHRIDFRVDLRADVGSVALAAVELQQVLVNLALNAADAMPDGGTLTVSTRRVRPVEGGLRRPEPAVADVVEFAVRDTGTGIDAATLPHIFEPFFTTKSRGRGTGLGLASAYGIATRARGAIHVESTVGAGTTFRLHLPPVAAATDAPRRPSSNAALSSVGGETILLAVRDDEVRRVLSVALFRSGYRVVEASGGGDALLAAEQQTGAIDLLLADAALPRIDGRNLFARLRGARPALRALYLSGSSDDGEPDVLTKPIDASELLRRVRAALQSGFR